MDNLMFFIAFLGVGFLGYLLYTQQLKWLLGVVRNMAVGVAGILVANLALAGMGIAVGVNAITLLVVGLLGAPGFLLLYVSRVLVGI